MLKCDTQALGCKQIGDLEPDSESNPNPYTKMKHSEFPGSRTQGPYIWDPVRWRGRTSHRTLFERSAGFQPPIMESLLLKHHDVRQPRVSSDVSGLSVRGPHRQRMSRQSSELSGHLFKRRERRDD